jgi:hypothetical protein
MRNPAEFPVFVYFVFRSVLFDQAKKEEKYPVSTHYFPSIKIQADQIPGSHKAKVLSEWVHPDVILEFWISDGNVTGHPFGETFTGEVTEDGCGVDEDVFAVFFVGGECGDACC